ncbi:hypothetical protein [Phaffia rhodozyma]|uniref:Uncharacterized protein n=1 Tax=Phaffia rhodozyma TaxID=264483 RepID=A0A0F7SPF3_PHARH|nr:hypothetical protein [Phaffia rhodozyma]
MASALAFSGAVQNKNPSTVAKGEVLDFCNKACIDDDGNAHCTKPFALEKSKCYEFAWQTKGNTFTHTTLELRNVKKPKDVVYYRDTNGKYTVEKSGLYYLDFVPRTGCDNEVEYEIQTCV